MNPEQPTVFLVDDDPAMRDALRFMFSGTDLRVEEFASAGELLEALPPEARGCVILDLRMPGMSGVELHEKLVAAGSHLPVIILTGHGDIPSAVAEMKRGAFDFLSKPVGRDVLLQRVREAIDLDLARRRDTDEVAEIKRLLATLSPREVEVMDQVALGQESKQIALSFGLSELTVANHRAHILRKMGAVNTADMVRKLGLGGHTPHPHTPRRPMAG